METEPRLNTFNGGAGTQGGERSGGVEKEKKKLECGNRRQEKKNFNDKIKESIRVSEFAISVYIKI